MINLYTGNCTDVLKTLDEKSVQCVVTSPPYWGLRDYGHGEQIGLESTPDAYVAALVAVFRDVRRVLKDDGVLWLNLGDSYASRGGPEPAQTKWQVTGASDGQAGGKSRAPSGGLKHKDLVGIPWRVAFALQADGWYLRQDIIWHKPNPMPESVRDRCTKAHEYLFLLTKSARYYWDAEPIREPVSPNWRPNNAPTVAELGAHVLTTGQRGHQRRLKYDTPKGANRRSVWTIPTQPYRGAHFAVMPEKLVEPCVLATTRPDDLVLDPFCGSGTVGVVAKRYGRHFTGVDLNADYIKLAEARIGKQEAA